MGHIFGYLVVFLIGFIAGAVFTKNSKHDIPASGAGGAGKEPEDFKPHDENQSN